MDTFPIATLRPTTFQIRLANTVRGSGSSLSDLGQVADWSGGGHWTGECREFNLSRVEQHLSWRGLIVGFDGGLIDFVLPVIDYCNDHLAGGTFTANASAAMRATNVVIANASGKVILGGEYFTIDHATAGPRLYCISANPGAVTSGHQAVKIRPPLREAITSGTVIDFVNPRLVVRMLPGPDCWQTIQAPFKARPTLPFVESFKYLESA